LQEKKGIDHAGSARAYKAEEYQAVTYRCGHCKLKPEQSWSILSRGIPGQHFSQNQENRYLMIQINFIWRE
jgi:hypothetical protein